MAPTDHQPLVQDGPADDFFLGNSSDYAAAAGNTIYPRCIMATVHSTLRVRSDEEAEGGQSERSVRAIEE